MRRFLCFVLILTLGPATAAAATDLEEILTRGQEASYSAEQVISCSTPDGSRSALVRIEQANGDLRVSSSVADHMEVTAGDGGWALTRAGGLVAVAIVDGSNAKGASLYTVEEGGEVEYLGRSASAFLLVRDGEPRAELVVDDDTGAVMEAVSLDADGDPYCRRRFISIDTSATMTSGGMDMTASPATPVEGTDLPEGVAGFELLDKYRDEGGVSFAYYSDGFFSFALFKTPALVLLPEATVVEFGSGTYARTFSAGQVSYVWETKDTGMALVGDLPPDMHEAILDEMPHPEDPGLLRRWWRALFGVSGTYYLKSKGVE